MKVSAKGLLIVGLGATALLAGAGAQAAQSDVGHAYVEVGYTQLNWTEGDFSVKPANALVRAGYQFNRIFAVEAVGAASVSSDTLDGVSFKVDNLYGADFKAQFEVAPRFDLFARAGWSHLTISGSFMGQSASVSDSGLSYGVGAQYHFTKNWYLQGDYASYFQKHGDSIKGPSLSVGYRF